MNFNTFWSPKAVIANVDDLIKVIDVVEMDKFIIVYSKEMLHSCQTVDTL